MAILECFPALPLGQLPEYGDGFVLRHALDTHDIAQGAEEAEAPRFRMGPNQGVGLGGPGFRRGADRHASIRSLVRLPVGALRRIGPRGGVNRRQAPVEGLLVLR